MQLQLFRLKFFCKVCSLCKTTQITRPLPQVKSATSWCGDGVEIWAVFNCKGHRHASQVTLQTHWERKLHPITQSCWQIPSPCLVYWVLVLRVHCVKDTFKPKEKNTTCIYSQSMITIWHTVNVGFLLAAVRSCSFVLPHFTNIWGKNSPDLRHLFIFHMFLYFTSDLVNIMNCTC